jgi:hypothetical protein
MHVRQSDGSSGLHRAQFGEEQPVVLVNTRLGLLKYVTKIPPFLSTTLLDLCEMKIALRVLVSAIFCIKNLVGNGTIEVGIIGSKPSI